MKNNTPTEHIECVQFANWLRFKNLKFSHIANETSIKNFAYLRKRKAAGLNSGVPDYIIIVPHKGLVFVEMKRKKGSNTTDSQKSWIDALNRLNGVEARICYGADEAINYLSEFL